MTCPGSPGFERLGCPLRQLSCRDLAPDALPKDQSPCVAQREQSVAARRHPPTQASSTCTQTRCPLPAPALWPSAEPALRAGPPGAAPGAAGPPRPSTAPLLHAATSKEGQRLGGAGPSTQGSVP